MGEYAYDLFYHQDTNTKGIELKFVSPDGHREIIFSKDSKVINTDEYIGTYNIFSPKDKNNHKKYDVDTYLR